MAVKLTTTKKKSTIKEVNTAIEEARVQYGIPGTSEVFLSEEYLKQDNWVEVTTTRPSMNHILDASGDWVIPIDLDVDKARKNEYLEAYPIDKQLKVLTDFLRGDETSKEEMLKIFDAIKEKYPRK